MFYRQRFHSTPIIIKYFERRALEYCVYMNRDSRIHNKKTSIHITNITVLDNKSQIYDPMHK